MATFIGLPESWLFIRGILFMFDFVSERHKMGKFPDKYYREYTNFYDFGFY